MSHHPTYRIETLGCKANAYDSRRLAEAMEGLGYRAAEGAEPAHVCLLNTCTVTAVADRKGRKLAARLAAQNPGARVFVTGCYAERDAGAVGAIKGVDGVFGRDEWDDLLAAVAEGPAPTGVLSGDFGISSFDGRARAFLKVQEGCDSGCAYCILPQVRGRPRSRPLDDVRAEAARLVAAGFAELVITGIHVGLYGRDLPDRPGVADVVRAVAETPGIGRVRLSSIEANEVDDDLLAAMAHPTVCAHLHVPLQSGDADVLRRMRRRYTPEQFERAVALARERLDRPAVTTDVMVGFPGETETEFAHTLALCERVRFSRLHVFPFSPRPGTPAAEMADRVPAEVVAERSRCLRELGDRMAAEWARGLIGRTVRVLFERRADDGRLTGYTDRYVPVRADEGKLGTVTYFRFGQCLREGLHEEIGDCP